MLTTSPNERCSREQVDAFAFAARAPRIAECYNKADRGMDKGLKRLSNGSVPEESFHREEVCISSKRIGKTSWVDKRCRTAENTPLK